MDFAELLKRRRMVRRYTGDPVPRDVLERIVATVRRAPSGGFSQGHRLLVVTDDETKRRIRALFSDYGYTDEWLATAGAFIVVGTREQDYHDRYTEPDKLAVTGGVEIEWPAPYWFVDAGAAMMLLLLAAIDEGLASGVFGVTVEKMAAFKELLAIPDEVHVVAVVTVGRPADEDGLSAQSSRMSQRRRQLDELVRWERWDAQ